MHTFCTFRCRSNNKSSFLSNMIKLSWCHNADVATYLRNRWHRVASFAPIPRPESAFVWVRSKQWFPCGVLGHFHWFHWEGQLYGVSFRGYVLPAAWLGLWGSKGLCLPKCCESNYKSAGLNFERHPPRRKISTVRTRTSPIKQTEINPD